MKYGYALVELQKFYDDEHIFNHDLEITVECLDLLYIHILVYLKSKQACRINRSHYILKDKCQV
jgi:hypothetical protein